MARRRRKKIIENVTITGIADKGMGVGRAEDGQVVFMKGGVPGDVVDVLVLRKKKSYAHGIVHKTHHFSSDRIEPRCIHFGLCGGCKWQNLAYDTQVQHKHQVIVDAMTRIAGIDRSIILPTIPCKDVFRYRNKLEYSFSTSQWLTRDQIESDDIIERQPGLGFHPAGSFDKVIDIHECHLQDQVGDQMRNFIREYAYANGLSFYNTRSHQGYLRNMIFRNNKKGEWMVIIATGEEKQEETEALLNTLQEKFPKIVSLYYVVNKKQNDSLFDQEMILFYGEPYLKESLGKITYNIGPKSFFQTNTVQAEVLYDTAVNLCRLKGDENVYDLYTGIGSIALYIADQCRQVVGIEEVEPAIEDAIRNQKLNNIDNAIFYVGDVKNILTDTFAERHGQPDVVITDPPRAGMHADVVQMLLKLESPEIVYVSCNPATQARDLKLLSEKYSVTHIQGVDMFPHTHHIESVARCALRK